MEQIGTREAVAKENGSQADATKSPKLDMPHMKSQTKGFASCGAGTGKPGGRKIKSMREGTANGADREV